MGQRAFASDMPKLKTDFGALVMDGLHDFFAAGKCARRSIGQDCLSLFPAGWLRASQA
ncbi:hypothetical protein UY416_11730 [Paenibacillus polymyxa]|uniref:hypothetical protein n=1 Tax=Paenibacillus polymyxa TaxID=1406 RepID=UPI002AB555DA|nr:hypothetical protein [Paenibacillus polymyxa]MDY8046956.1 hypothetical protein [Paenibacillus polymyxa]